MRIIVAILFAVVSSVSFGGTLTTQDYNQQIVGKAKLIKTVHIKKIPHPRLFRSNTLRLQSIINHKFDDIDVDDTDIIIDRRRWNKEYFKPAPDLSDYVRLRLLIARTRALKKFAETHGNLV